MDEKESQENLDELQPAPPVLKAGLQEVSVIRSWKEYLVEAALIVFSVVLAILFTEIINNIHEDHHTRLVLHQLRLEIVSNQESEKIQYAYHLGVLKKIDSALSDAVFRKRFLDSGKIHLNVIASSGVMRKDLDDIAWQAAKQNNILAKIDLEVYSLLADIYDNQQRITKAENEIGTLLLSFESRKPENAVLTLILMKDNYHGWAVDRAPDLMKKYERAIDALKEY